MRSLMKAGLLLAVSGLVTTAALAAPGDKTYTSELMTRWGRDVTPETAWQSYPRPQMKRAAWKNLNGLWDYAITKDAAARPDRMDGQILVPFPVESKLSRVARKVLPDDRVWYRSISARWTMRRRSGSMAR
jgi:hypothetical protein